MGVLQYGDSAREIAFDDRTLIHVKQAMFAKLRRGESFPFSWRADDGRRRTIWISPSIPLGFEFDEPERPKINREWLVALARTASTESGMVVVDEPVEVGHPADSRRHADVVR